MLTIILAFITATVILTQSNAYKKAKHPIKYSEYVNTYSKEFDIDPYLMYALIKTESGFDPKAISTAGAIGLTQITSETFDWIKLKLCPYEEIVFEDLYTPEVSIRFGAYFLSRSLERYNGSIETASAAYHSGWGTVDSLIKQQGSDVLLEFPYTQMNNYVYKINKSYKTYKELYENIKGV